MSKNNLRGITLGTTYTKDSLSYLDINENEQFYNLKLKALIAKTDLTRPEQDSNPLPKLSPKLCITAMINHIFICFSAVQIYDLSYIHLHSLSSQSHNVTSSQWLERSLGRALHRYRRGHGLESFSGLDLF